MIPKIIHYCWFNDSPIPKSLRICMESWKKVLPDYEWRLWDIHSFDIQSLVWTKEAYNVGALAFVSDYVRLFALYNEGGIYLDTDVFVRKTFDPLLSNGFFTSIEYHPEVIALDKLSGERLNEKRENIFNGEPVPGIQLLSAVLGAQKGHPFVKDVMTFYEDKSFIREDGRWYTHLIAPDILALIGEKYGLKYDKDMEQHLDSNITIYPSSVLAASYVQITDSTIAVHLSKGSWRKRSWLRGMLTKINFYRKIYGAR